MISSIVSDDLDGGLSWILVDPRATSRGSFSSPECLTLSIRLWPDVGAKNEIKTLAFLPSLPEYKSKNPASETIYVVEEGTNLISFANVFKSLLADLIKKPNVAYTPDHLHQAILCHVSNDCDAPLL